MPSACLAPAPSAALHLARILAPALFLAACADDPPAAPAAEGDAGAQEHDASATSDGATSTGLREVALIDHKGWANYPADLDPLLTHQPEELRCTIIGWFYERGSLEVDTGHCNYALIEHPAAYDVPADSELSFQVGHFDLLAPEPATAHVALLFDGDVQWETTVDIPGPGDLQTYTFRASRALAAGEPIRLHLHNHGQNTWLFGPLQARIP